MQGSPASRCRKRGPAGRCMAVFIGALAWLLVTFGPAAADPQISAEDAFRELIDAIQARSMEQFTALGDDEFKAMPAAEFEKLAAKFAPMLESGYTATYMGEFEQAGTTVYYWRLTFTTDPDDYLAKLGIRAGKLRGFLIERP